MSLRDESPESRLIVGKPRSAVYRAIVAILEEQSTAPSESGGVSVRSISSYLQSRDNGRYSRKYISQLIERETVQDKIIKVSEDSVTLSRDDLIKLDQKWKQERRTSENGRESETGKGRQMKTEKSMMPSTSKPERVGQRTKRAKKVFDPSDIEVPPTKRRGRPVGSGKRQLTSPQRKPGPVLLAKKPLVVHDTARSPRVTPPPTEVQVKVEKSCRLCQGSGTNTAAGESENLITCRSCSVWVHPSCLGFDRTLCLTVQEKPWLCPDCRPCSVCRTFKDEDPVLCSGCDTVFHCCCLDPKLENYPEGRWLCRRCKQDAERRVISPSNNNNNPALVTTANIGLWMFATHQLELKGPPLTCAWSDASDEPGDSSIPDASAWNVDDVQKYFKDVGLEVHARVFKDQDVDGTSLLLLKRDDVVRHMGLKLGPALKIYRHVRYLQTGPDASDASL